MSEVRLIPFLPQLRDRFARSPERLAALRYGRSGPSCTGRASDLPAQLPQSELGQV